MENETAKNKVIRIKKPPTTWCVGGFALLERGEFLWDVVPLLVGDEEVLERLVDLHDEGVSADVAEVTVRVIELPAIALAGRLGIATFENPVAEGLAATVVDDQPISALAGSYELLPLQLSLWCLECTDKDDHTDHHDDGGEDSV